jgi:RNA polymerase sigma-70 factor, ECF subfamily
MNVVANPTLASPADADAPADPELIQLVLGGERDRFEVLVRRHNQRLYRIVRAILRNDSEAEDCVQHAHMTAFRQLAQFRGEASYATWLTRIAVNEAFARIRRSKDHVLVSLDVAGGDAARSTTATPEDETYQHELGRLLERHIDDLPDGLRVVFMMREVEELDTAETASLLGLSEAAVRVRLHRARGALQASLTGAMTAASDAFRFAGERCERITRSVLATLDRVESS